MKTKILHLLKNLIHHKNVTEISGPKPKIQENEVRLSRSRAGIPYQRTQKTSVSGWNLSSTLAGTQHPGIEPYLPRAWLTKLLSGNVQPFYAALHLCLTLTGLSETDLWGTGCRPPSMQLHQQLPKRRQIGSTSAPASNEGPLPHSSCWTSVIAHFERYGRCHNSCLQLFKTEAIQLEVRYFSLLHLAWLWWWHDSECRNTPASWIKLAPTKRASSLVRDFSNRNICRLGLE